MKKFIFLAAVFITLFSKDLLAYNQPSDFPNVKAAQKNYDLALEALNQTSKKLTQAQSNVPYFEKVLSEKKLQCLKFQEQHNGLPFDFNIPAEKDN